MKKTLFTAMLAAALLGGGSAFAGTVVTGYDATYSNLPHHVFGSYAKDSASYGRVTISEVAGTGYDKLEVVAGGLAYTESSQGPGAFNNTVVMTGGNVDTIIGGAANGKNGSAYMNTVVVDGGTVGEVRGGSTTHGEESGNAHRNTVVVTGGRITAVYAGVSPVAPDSNSVCIVGTGASYYHQGVRYTGKEINIGTVAATNVESRKLRNNALNISGTDIQIGKVGTDFQLLNFHLLEGQLTGTSPMVTVTEETFTITEGLELSFDALDGMEWKPGTSVTLVEAQKGMDIDAPGILDKEYDIYRKDDPAETVLATAKLVLEQGQGTTRFLKLVVPGNVPEPATGTLSLLALAALAARRRKK